MYLFTIEGVKGGNKKSRQEKSRLEQKTFMGNQTSK